MHFHVTRTDHHQFVRPAALRSQEHAQDTADLMEHLGQGTYRVDACSDLMHEFEQVAEDADWGAECDLLMSMSEAEARAYLDAQWLEASGGKPAPEGE